MELRVQLKICEGCGCLFYRTEARENIYCHVCKEKLRDFPSPESRKRRGRPGRKTIPRIWAVGTAAGGVR
jgi:hypothetical protein